jgi:hypothetical protein
MVFMTRPAHLGTGIAAEAESITTRKVLAVLAVVQDAPTGRRRRWRWKSYRFTVNHLGVYYKSPDQQITAGVSFDISELQPA